MEPDSNTHSNMAKNLKSPVWKYFERNDAGAKCSICSKVYKLISGSTTSLIRHIEHVHDISLSGKTKKNYMAKDTPRAQSLTQAIAYMMAVDYQPFSIVDDKGFRYFTKIAEPRFQIPCRTTFSREIIPELYAREKVKIQAKISRDLQNGVRTIAATTDGWESAAGENYMSLTLHYITKEFEMKHFTLANIKYAESHTGENLCKFLEDELRAWKLDPEQLSTFFITDNAPNMVKAIRLGKKWIRIPCFGHTLQLVIKDALNNYKGFNEVYKKCKRIVTHFNHSSKDTEKLLEMQRLQKEREIPLSLIQDIDTRWNSQLAMLSRLLILRRPLSAVLSDPGMPDGLTSDEWHKIEIYVEALEPFQDATVLMSGDTYPTLSRYISTIVGLRKILQSQLEENQKDITLTRKLLNGLNDRFDFIFTNEHLLTAMIIDPCFKDRIINQETKKVAFNAVKAKMIKCFIENESDFQKINSPSDKTAPPPLKKLKLSQFFDSIEENDSKEFLDEEEVTDTKVTKELQKYLNEKVAPAKTEATAWWKINVARYPILGLVASDYLGIPATQTSSERLFSTAGNFVTKKRTQLDSSHVNELCFLHSNLTIPDIEHPKPKD